MVNYIHNSSFIWSHIFLSELGFLAVYRSSNPALCSSNCVHACQCSFSSGLSTSYPSYCLKKSCFLGLSLVTNDLHCTWQERRPAPKRESLYNTLGSIVLASLRATSDRPPEAMKSKLGVQLVAQPKPFSPTPNPHQLCFSLCLQELTSPFLSLAADLTEGNKTY